MENTKNIEYLYYLHKTRIVDYKDIESFFNEGLKSRYNYRIHSTLAPISEDTLKNYGLANQIVSYCGMGEEYNAVVVVKIPRKYFAEILHRNNKIDPSVPMFREYDDKSSNWTSVFTPKLIQGIYCRDINKSFTNPNFNPVFEPAGCQFSDEQIGYFNSYYLVDWLKFDKARKNCSFQDLYASDKAHKTWDAIVNHYSNLFGVKPTPMVQYTMSEGHVFLPVFVLAFRRRSCHVKVKLLYNRVKNEWLGGVLGTPTA